MFKNVASQKLIVYAFDSTTNLPKTGDAANIMAYVSKDYGTVTVLGDTTATEMDATNAKGYYLFDLTQAETDADTLLFSAKSATANIVVLAMPAVVFTTPPNFTALGIATTGQVGPDFSNVKQATGATTLTNITIPTVTTAAGLGAGAITDASIAAGSGIKSVATGTAQAGGATTVQLAAGSSATNDFYKGQRVYLTGGTGAGQDRIITGYVGSTTTATVDRAWATNPDATSTYAVRPDGVTGPARDVSFPTNLSALGITTGGQVGLDFDNIHDATGAHTLTNIRVPNVTLTDTVTDVTNVDDARMAHLDADVSSRLAPTTAGRTLDVAATGEAGLDFDNIHDATGAHTLTNIRVPNVTLTDTVTTYTGNTPQTGDAYARLGAPTGASVSADIAAVQAEFPANFPALGITVAGKLSEVVLVDTTTALTNAVTLAASQPNYAPAKAGDAMTLTSAYNAAKTAAQAGDAMALTSGERTTLADVILVRDWAFVEGTAPIHSLAALIPAAFLFTYGSTFDTYKSDGTTLFHSYNLTGSAATGANVITSLGV